MISLIIIKNFEKLLNFDQQIWIDTGMDKIIALSGIVACKFFYSIWISIT